jgi:hypothetical protein
MSLSASCARSSRPRPAASIILRPSGDAAMCCATPKTYRKWRRKLLAVAPCSPPAHAWKLANDKALVPMGRLIATATLAGTTPLIPTLPGTRWAQLGPRTSFRTEDPRLPTWTSMPTSPALPSRSPSQPRLRCSAPASRASPHCGVANARRLINTPRGLHRSARRLDLRALARRSAFSASPTGVSHSRRGVSHSRRGVSHLCQPLIGRRALRE